MTWIKCSDRLPEKGKEVIYIDESKNIYIGSLYSGRDREYWLSYDYTEDKGITHWMPLPEPPPTEPKG
jgi:hypothetical protein